ncbi:family 20 glycosylhydrolase [Bacteroides sp. 519]|uniref:glycoside hydrolase family 20 protein n=1 Tax=Bacteroides sp. 519 TaxID=2302937 RepID=UPI0013D8C571|nr:family 20 glycosylhydrolase [Bacteroides sp. 519]NDV56563.1 beta-N-acetylhexosaminidase [Bacteroides sp. 519]
MKKSLFLNLYVTSLLLLTACGSPQVNNADYNVVPLPQKTEPAQGASFIMNSNTTIVYPEQDENLKRIANFLSDYIKFSTGYSLQTSDKEGANSIVLRSNLTHTNKEAYTLTVNSEQIVVNGASSAGTFYGIQTLRKSIPAASDGCAVSFSPVTIEDYPRFGYRGMMLDVGRHMFPVEFIKEYIDIIALHNMNTFHWHITDDQGWRIEIKKYPELTEKGAFRKKTVIGRNTGEYDDKPYGGFYTQEEAREIVAYAKDRFITIIPEVDLPGHMLAALHAYPHLGCTGGPYEVSPEWGIFDDVLCPGNSDVYTFLEDVFTEITDIFPSEYIHIGGDECPKVRWAKCPKCQAKIKQLGIKADKEHSAEEKLQSYVMSYVESFLNNKGRKIIGWDEILEGGLAPNATVMSWRGTEGAIAAAKQGHDAIMVPTSHLYFDYYQTANVESVPLSIGGYVPLSKVYSFNPIPKELSESEAKHILGVQANLWTEYVTTTQQVEFKVLPRMDALAEIQWCLPENRNYDAFLKRLSNMIKHYNKKGYNYAKTVYEINAKTNSNSDKGVIELTLSTIDDAPIYYTLDGSTPTQESTKYAGTLSFSEGTTIMAKAIRPDFETPVYTNTFSINKATMKPVTISQEPHRSYTFGGAPVLVDGMSGNKGNYKDGSWLGFSRSDFEIDIDLKEPTSFSEVSLNSYVCTGDWIFGIKELAILVSEDGKVFKPVATQTFPDPAEHTEKVFENKVTFDTTQSRYVKILVKKENSMPAWHGGAGKPAFVFVDEVSIN